MLLVICNESVKTLFGEHTKFFRYLKRFTPFNLCGRGNNLVFINSSLFNYFIQIFTFRTI